MQPYFDENTDPFDLIGQSGMEIPEIMGEMMDRGYLVTGPQGNVNLVKVITDQDSKANINPDTSLSDRTIIKGIPNKTHALAIYLTLRDKPEAHAPKLITWVGQVRYEIGRNIKFYDLSDIQSSTYEGAMLLAKAQAGAFIESRPDLKPFGYKEVKVRPA